MTSVFTRFDLLELGLYSAVSALAGGANVHWAKGSPLPDELGDEWVTLSVISGPVPETQTQNAKTTIPNVTSVTYQIASAADGAIAGLQINGQTAYADASGDTPTTLRDKLVAALTPLLGDENSVAASGADSLIVTQSAPGSLRLALGAGVCEFVSATTSGIVKVRETGVLVLVQADCGARAGADGLGPAGDATGLANRVALVCSDDDAEATLYRHGLAPRTATAPADLSRVEAGSWESRQVVTLTIAMQQVTARLGYAIQDLSLSLVVRDLAGTALENLQISEATP